MKKTILFTVLLVLLCPVLHGQFWHWARSYGSENLEYAWDVDVDIWNSINVVGSFTDSMMIGDITLYGNGLDDIYVIKMSETGTVLWARSFGSDADDTALSISSDYTGNIYITGYYSGDMYVGDTLLECQGMWDAYLIKLDYSGNVVFATSFGGNLNDIGYGVSCDGARVFVTGWYASTMSFANGLETTSAGGSDIYLACFDLDGTPLWVRSAGTEGVEYGFDVTSDYAGNAYVTGVCGDQTDFDGLLLQGSGGFVASYDLNGQVRWVSRMQNASVSSIGCSMEGQVTGRYSGTAYFGNHSISSIGGSDDAYYARFELDTGNWIEAVSAGGPGADMGRGCAESGAGAIQFFVGTYSETADLFGWQSTFSGGFDSYLHVITPYEVALPYLPEIVFFGGEYDTIVSSVAMMGSGTAVVCGWHSGSTQFGNHTVDSGSPSNTNMFVAKFLFCVVENEDLVSQAITSLRAYPNPFSSELKISYKAEVASSLSISIFNLRGQQVCNLFEGNTNKGEMELSWDGKDASGARLPAGIYFIRAQNQAGSSTVKALKW